MDKIPFDISKLDFVEFERRQRHILNELAMKRGQVEELKKELNAAKLKIHEQNRTIESGKSTIEEHKHNLSLALKNTRFLEDTLQAKRDGISRTHLQQESAVAERENLRGLLQKTELQNYNLIRELNELKSQHNCDVAYQKEFVNENAKIREKIAQLNEAMQSYVSDQKKIIELSNKMEMLERLQETTTFYREELYKSKNKYQMLEEKFILSKSTVDKFEKLVHENSVPFQISQESEIIIEQWEKTTKRLTEQCKKQQEVINSLTKKFKNENETNVKLCLQETEFHEEIKKLKEENCVLTQKLQNLNKHEADVQEDDVPTKLETATNGN